VKAVISGATGRMGQTLVGLMRVDPDWQLVAGIDRVAMSAAEAEPLGFPAIETSAGASAAILRADVILDFSASAGLATLLEKQSSNLRGKALVIGTTGLPSETRAQLDALARQSAVILSANFSVGVNLMLGVVAAAARVLPAESFDVEIMEAHHRHKADAPSGTALLLGGVVAEGRGSPLTELRRDGRSGKTGERARGEIGFHSVRGGEVVGEHRVLFLGERERFEIAHAAADRGVFAEGALLAARWLVGKPAGMYSMKDVLGL
jgi:4-hydroxy-tetrahydrodipicolinate reductase